MTWVYIEIDMTERESVLLLHKTKFCLSKSAVGQAVCDHTSKESGDITKHHETGGLVSYLEKHLSILPIYHKQSDELLKE